MPVKPITEEETPGRITQERIHVKLPDWPPHHGRVIQIMPGHKVPVDPEGNEVPIVWAESMELEPNEAHTLFAAKDEGHPAFRKVRTTVAPSPKKP